MRKGNARQRAANDRDRAFFGRLCARITAASTFPTQQPHSPEPQTKTTSIRTHEKTIAPENLEDIKYTAVTVYMKHV